MKLLKFPPYMPDTLKIKEIMESYNQLLLYLNEKGIIELEELEGKNDEKDET